MSINIQTSGTTARITISDRFDSSFYSEFKQAYAPLLENQTIQLIEVDVSALQYMDSGALGMLMQLNERAKNARKVLTLIGVPGRVADILKTAHADKLFTINLPSGIKLDLRK